MKTVLLIWTRLLRDRKIKIFCKEEGFRKILLDNIVQ